MEPDQNSLNPSIVTDTNSCSKYEQIYEYLTGDFNLEECKMISSE